MIIYESAFDDEDIIDDLSTDFTADVTGTYPTNTKAVANPSYGGYEHVLRLRISTIPKKARKDANTMLNYLDAIQTYMSNVWDLFPIENYDYPEFGLIVAGDDRWQSHATYHKQGHSLKEWMSKYPDRYLYDKKVFILSDCFDDTLAKKTTGCFYTMKCTLPHNFKQINNLIRFMLENLLENFEASFQNYLKESKMCGKMTTIDIGNLQSGRTEGGNAMSVRSIKNGSKFLMYIQKVITGESNRKFAEKYFGFTDPTTAAKKFFNQLCGASNNDNIYVEDMEDHYVLVIDTTPDKLDKNGNFCMWSNSNYIREIDVDRLIKDTETMLKKPFKIKFIGRVHMYLRMSYNYETQRVDPTNFIKRLDQYTKILSLCTDISLLSISLDPTKPELFSYLKSHKIDISHIKTRIVAVVCDHNRMSLPGKFEDYIKFNLGNVGTVKFNIKSEELEHPIL